MTSSPIIATRDFGPAPGQFLGSSAGLPGPMNSKLTQIWQGPFADRDLPHTDHVHVWADGIHVNIRLEEHRLCLPVMIGLRADGRKGPAAPAGESTESWADLLWDRARRGMRARCWRRGRRARVLGRPPGGLSRHQGAMLLVP